MRLRRASRYTNQALKEPNNVIVSTILKNIFNFVIVRLINQDRRQVFVSRPRPWTETGWNPHYLRAHRKKLQCSSGVPQTLVSNLTLDTIPVSADLHFNRTAASYPSKSIKISLILPRIFCRVSPIMPSRRSLPNGSCYSAGLIQRMA